MAVQVLTAASNQELLDLDVVKMRLKLDGKDADPRLKFLIAEATATIERELGRPLARQQYRETLGSAGELRLMVSRLPVEPGFSVELDGQPIEGVMLENPEAGILFRDHGWTPTGSQAGFPSTATARTWLTRRPIARSEAPRLTVTYWAGYLLPDQLPADLARAAFVAVKDWYLGEGTSSQVAAIATPDLKVQLKAGDPLPLPEASLALLEGWPRV